MNFISSLLPLEGAVSSDIVSPGTFGVNYFNEKNRLVLASSVFKNWALKDRSKIGGNTLNHSRKMVVVHANLFEMFFWKHISFNELSVSNIKNIYFIF